MTGIGAKDCDGILIPAGRENIKRRGEMYSVDGDWRKLQGAKRGREC